MPQQTEDSARALFTEGQETGMASSRCGEWELSGCGESSVLRLHGSVDIAAAADLKAALLKALESSKQVQVVTLGVSDLDVTALQLLWAARRAAAERAIEFTVSSEPAGSAVVVLTELAMENLGILG
jgi:anti-anti-sigma regulatory factor